MSTYADPRVDPQLQQDVDGTTSPTEGADCAVRVIQGLVRWATRGRLVLTTKQIRAKIGVLTGGLTPAQALAAYQAYGVTSTRTGDFSKLGPALAVGKAAHASIGYAWVNDNAPELSGDTKFRGGHAIGVFGDEKVLTRAGAPSWSEWLDPLHDGRFSNGKRVPKQVVMCRESQLLGAMQAFGHIDAIIVEQEPAPAADCTACEDALESALKLSRARGDAIQSAKSVLNAAP